MRKIETTTRAPAFSLIELLVVIAIIALVIAIIVPALGGARTAAKKAATANLLAQVTDAAMQFSQDNSGQMPGYFTPGDMGDPRNMNADGGFTAMENVLLDLLGRHAIVGSGDPGELVGPFGGGTGNVRVDFDLLGTGEGVYLHKVEGYLEVASGQVGSQAHQDFPDLVDAFGNPVLAWVEDPTGPREPADLEEFATSDSDRGRARFYWASNAGWLQSTAMGKSGKDQTYDSGSKSGSLLADPDQADMTLSAALGNPNFPIPTNFQAGSVRPKSARGAFIVHSAGADGIFFGAKDQGAKSIGVDGSSDQRQLNYRFNFYADYSGSNRLKDSTGKITSIDVSKGFDDIMNAGGN